ncbi:hypothetical protein F5Y03DRAFT_371248 [Xylaria venustula]|nr:hypothetical protein F5Y03DRAFT_371248 [Xylaria venustula]
MYIEKNSLFMVPYEASFYYIPFLFAIFMVHCRLVKSGFPNGLSLLTLILLSFTLAHSFH